MLLFFCGIGGCQVVEDLKKFFYFFEKRGLTKPDIGCILQLQGKEREVNKTRGLEEIIKLVAEMDDELFEKLNNDYCDWMYEVFDANARRNAKRRLNRDLVKAGLTLEEYEMWDE